MSDEQNKKSNGGWGLVPPLFMFLAIMIMVAGRNNSYISAPLPPRPRITTIPQGDAHVVALKAFAESNGLTWEISPDTVDGTSYCATLMTKHFTSTAKFFEAIHCRDSIWEATDAVMGEWNNRNVRAGSD